MHSGSGLVHTLQKMDHLSPSIALLLQLGVYEVSHAIAADIANFMEASSLRTIMGPYV